MRTVITRSLRLLLAIAAVVLVVAPVQAESRDSDKRKETSRLKQYARDTWRSFEAMIYPDIGLPADNISDDGVQARYTSPTNIATYIWSTLAARDLHIIERVEARAKIGKTLDTLARLERHIDSGMYHNWYDPATGEKLTIWPTTGAPLSLFLSTVDNGWLAAALIIVSNAVPQLRDQAEDLLADMDFGFHYDPVAGLLRLGFWVEPPPNCSIQENYPGRGADVFYTCFHYGTLNTEPRIASYIAIALGQVPETHYSKMWRTLPGTCDWGWQEMQPQGETRTYLGVEVFEGHYTYRGMNIVPSWGGSMFEALMVPLLVPEEEWGPESWEINHPLYVEAQIEHGLKEAQYDYWGFSPSNNPSGGYREYGVDAIGMRPDGYASNNDTTLVDYGFGDCPGREPQPIPVPSAYTNGVVTPHASFLGLEFAPDAALENLEHLRENFDIYTPGGFYDSVNLQTGEVSKYHLALNQGMIMLAIGNELRHDRLQHYFTQGAIEAAIEPLLEMEQFTAGKE